MHRQGMFWTLQITQQLGKSRSGFPLPPFGCLGSLCLDSKTASPPTITTSQNRMDFRVALMGRSLVRKGGSGFPLPPSILDRLSNLLGATPAGVYRCRY